MNKTNIKIYKNNNNIQNNNNFQIKNKKKNN